ncbi:HSP20-like chaperone [Trametes sanguinea]|nr:HSP20-like chaperone [Trametes sanguinea]
MALSTFFAEPFYSLADFESLFDEAFNARTSAVAPRQHVNCRTALLVALTQNTDDVPCRMDLHEDQEKNLVTATFELPGLSKENVQIDVRDNVLNVSGESTISSERDEKGYSVRERRYGKFSRSLLLPQGIKPEEIKAYMENGMLTVTFPRTTPEQAPKKSTIS